jgi:hypothetical protein
MNAKEDILRSLRTQSGACTIHGWHGIAGVIDDAIKHIEASDAEIVRIKDLIDRDRTGLAAGLNEVKRVAAGWDWLCEGRGPYEYDDDRYRMEIGALISKVVDVANAALKASGDRANEAFIPRARLTAQHLTEACAEERPPT